MTRKLDPILSGVAGHFLVAAELSRRGFIATPTVRNTRGVDVLAASPDGKRAVTIQVKTNQSGKPVWVLNEKDELISSKDLFYVFVNLNGSEGKPEFHIVDSPTVAKYARDHHKEWLSGTKKGGGSRKDTSMRKFRDVDNRYLNAWERLGLG